MKINVYFERRRQASEMTRTDIDTMIGWPAGTMANIEEGRAAPTNDVIAMLYGTFAFSPDVAIALREGSFARVCRVCACSEYDPCDHPDEGACGWAKPDLCTHCVFTAEASHEAAEG